MAKEAPSGPTTSLSTWRFWDQHVQNDMPGGNFINAATVLIAAGPPRLADTGLKEEVNLDSGGQGGSNLAYPIGVVENFGMQQNRMVQKLFEIGSKRAYHIPGRTVGTVSLGRILFWGPSLMRVMYAYYPSAKMKGANDLDNVSADLDKNGKNPSYQRPGWLWRPRRKHEYSRAREQRLLYQSGIRFV